MKIKVFTCNYDGTMQRMVAARSMRQAAMLTAIPYQHFREYGSVTGNADDCKLAMQSIGTVYEQECTSINEWREIKVKQRGS